MNRRIFLGSAVGASAGFWLSLATPRVADAAAGQEMANGFAQPPGSFRPWVYWFWINGNLTRKGITADLEAMERVGIGGVLIMEVDGTPAGSVGFGTRIWRDMFQWACQEAARLGIVINMNNDAGWTGSAGPWITPELSMQMVVYSELSLEGGRRFDGDLPKPRRSTESDGSLSGPGGDFYKDIAVIAFPTPGNTAYRISDIRFKADFDARSTPPVAGNGVGPWSFPMLPVTPEAAPADASIDRERIVDLTAAFREGRLTWDAPAGNWTVMRFGHVSTGRTNHPTSPGGAGLECDKLSKQAAELQFNSFIAELAGLIGPLSGKALVATHVDSWEVGSQNWTPRFGEEFRRRCGYDITPFLPVIAGRVVGDIEISERFLWDLRKTVSDMIAENYVGHLRELAKRRGLSFSCEAYDGDPLDEMRVAGESDTPQSEFWYRRETQPVGECGDFTTEYLRTYSWTPAMASAAHIYGRRLVPAEAFTAVPGENWLAHPALMKPQGDWAFCAGINRFIFHRYAMQPWLNRKPGMTMAYWGVHYERTQTWWEETKPWHEYLTRCQYLLQKGLFVADLLYMQAEGAPNRFMPPGVNYSNPVPPDPPGYNFDGCTADVVFKRVSIKDGRIVLPDGMSYRAMVLPGPGEQVMAGVMTPELARRIETLVNDGMTVIGPPPLKSPSLTNYPQCETELKEIVNRLWGDARAPGERRVGKGRVIWGKKPQEVLAAMGVPVDFSCGDPPPFRYIHRRAEDGSEIYFVANKRGAPVEAVCNFRVCGRRPEFWWPETGSIEKPAMYSEANGVASLPIRLSDFGSVFVVFRPNSAPEADRLTGVTRDGNALATGIGGMIQVSRAPSGGFESLVWQAGRYTLRTATGATRHVHAPTLPAPVRIAGPWSVRFTPGWGAPERIELPELISWSDHSESGVRYFSGKATYTKTIQVEASMLGRGRLVYLDLGSVEVMARVKWNGKELGILWKKPFKIDITGAARAGANSLELTVVNLWPNRLIGDAHLPDDCEWGSGGGMAAAMGGPGGGGVQQNISKYPQWLLDGKPSPTGRFTFSIIRVWPKDAPLRKSGLLGPVTLVPAMKA